MLDRRASCLVACLPILAALTASPISAQSPEFTALPLETLIPDSVATFDRIMVRALPRPDLERFHDGALAGLESQWEKRGIGEGGISTFELYINVVRHPSAREARTWVEDDIRERAGSHRAVSVDGRSASLVVYTSGQGASRHADVTLTLRQGDTVVDVTVSADGSEATTDLVQTAARDALGAVLAAARGAGAGTSGGG